MINNQPVTYHTLREIYQQPDMWRKTYQMLLSREKEISEFLSEYNGDDVTILFSGAGTSSFIGDILEFILPKYGLYNIKSASTTDITTHPQAFFHKNRKYILVSFARSGNSPESLAAVDIANSICDTNIAHIVITCNENGELAKRAVKRNILLLNLPPETNDIGLAMTSSFSTMLLASILIFDSKNLLNKKEAVNNLYKKAEYFISNYTDQIKKIAAIDFERAIFLGSGELKGIAEECHLKLQELTDGKVICLFDSFLGLRHGPKAASNEKTLLVYLFSEDDKVFQYERDLVVQTNQQVKPIAQIYMSQKKRKAGNVEFDLEMLPESINSTELDVILYVLIGQLLGFYKSIELNLDPDNPSASGKIARVVEGVTIY